MRLVQDNGVDEHGGADTTLPAPTYPGAVAPERTWMLAVPGAELRLHEWGDPSGQPVVLCHGMFDHARGFDTLAPLLAERFRVVGVDARGHGDSSWSDAYTWLADLIDLASVLAALGRPAHLVGHSRGGGQVTDVAARCPKRVRQLVNIDGFGPPPSGFAIPGSPQERTTRPASLARFLDHRRRSANEQRRRTYPSLEELVERRREQNPRLSREWLRYFLYFGARRQDDGWVWKVDPYAGRGTGPWNPEWMAPGWATLRAPMLALIGSEPDTWGPLPEEIIAPRLAHVPVLARATVRSAGHFVHMEQPRETARLVLDFLER